MTVIHCCTFKGKVVRYVCLQEAGMRSHEDGIPCLFWLHPQKDNKCLHRWGDSPDEILYTLRMTDAMLHSGALQHFIIVVGRLCDNFFYNLGVWNVKAILPHPIQAGCVRICLHRHM